MGQQPSRICEVGFLPFCGSMLFKASLPSIGQPQGPSLHYAGLGPRMGSWIQRASSSSQVKMMKTHTSVPHTYL